MPLTERIDENFVDSFRRPATQRNWLRDFNPISLLLILASLAVVAVAIPGIIAPFVIGLVFIPIAVLGGVGRSFIATYAKLWIVVGLLLFVLRAALIEGEHVIFEIGPITVTEEGVMDGLQFSLTVMAISGAVALFFALVPMKYLMLALELKGVSPRATYVLLASFQAITDLGKNARTVMEAQKSRGIETDGNAVQRLKAFFPILAPVFLSAMTSTEERSIALDARAFSSREPHSHLVSLRTTPKWEGAVVIVAIAGAVLAVVWAVLSWL
ncbi:MAG: energy-coupling factor transporter transmembrane component T [Rhodoglobus sp.]